MLTEKVRLAIFWLELKKLKGVCGKSVTMLKFLLLVNKQGHTRVSQYYEYLELEERTNLEAEITRKCLARSDDQVTIDTHVVSRAILAEGETGQKLQ